MIYHENDLTVLSFVFSPVFIVTRRRRRVNNGNPILHV
jgi:hypothetical protein